MPVVYNDEAGRIKGGLFHGGCLIGLARASAAFDRVHGENTSLRGLESGIDGWEEEEKLTRALTAGRMSIEGNLQSIQRGQMA